MFHALIYISKRKMISFLEINLILLVCFLVVDSKIEPCFQDGVYFTKDGSENWGSSKEPDETFCQGRQEICMYKQFSSNYLNL